MRRIRWVALLLLIVGVVWMIVRDGDPRYVQAEIVAYLKANKTASIPLAVLAKHPVSRVCLIREYDRFENAAGRYGFLDRKFHAEVYEGNVGLLMINDHQATMREIGISEMDYEWLSEFAPYGRPWREEHCIEGANIQLKYRAVEPSFEANQVFLRGGRLKAD
jgi:hypothetical protein